MLQKSLQNREALAREEQNKLVSSFKTQPQEKKSNTQPTKHVQASAFKVKYSQNTTLGNSVIYWVQPVASQKCAALCFNSCPVCNYVDIYYVRKQQPNKATIKKKKKNLTFRVTWLNVILIHVSGHRKKNII